MVTSMVKTACERDDAWFRLVDPTERCFVARLRDVHEHRQRGGIDRTHEYNVSNSSTEEMSSVLRFATNT
jgi:hypothetical protein